MAKSIQPKDFQAEVDKILEKYFDGVADDSIRLVAEVAEETRQELESNSPKAKDSGKYAKSWKIRQGKKLKASNEVEVYNKQYQLTHLLEHGHVAVVHGKVVGFTSPRPHIADAEQHAIEKLSKGIERSIKQ